MTNQDGPMSPYDEIMKSIEPGEHIQAVAFGLRSTDVDCRDEELHQLVEAGKLLNPIPPFGQPMAIEEAKPYLSSNWTIENDYVGYSVVVWTTRRIGIVSTYDGHSTLEWIPKEPTVGFHAKEYGG